MTPLGLLWQGLGGLRAVLMRLVMVASLTLNVAMAAVPAVAAAVGGAVQAITGLRGRARRNADQVAGLETRAEGRAAAAVAARPSGTAQEFCANLPERSLSGFFAGAAGATNTFSAVYNRAFGAPANLLAPDGARSGVPSTWNQSDGLAGEGA